MAWWHVDTLNSRCASGGMEQKCEADWNPQRKWVRNTAVEKREDSFCPWLQALWCHVSSQKAHWHHAHTHASSLQISRFYLTVKEVFLSVEACDWIMDELRLSCLRVRGGLLKWLILRDELGQPRFELHTCLSLQTVGPWSLTRSVSSMDQQIVPVVPWHYLFVPSDCWSLPLSVCPFSSGGWVLMTPVLA